MLIGALGCNLAWGIIDAGMYLMSRLHEHGHNILVLRAVRDATNLEAARHAITNALPPLLASALPLDQLEIMREKLRQLPEPPIRPSLTKQDGGRCGGRLFACFSIYVSGRASVHVYRRCAPGIAVF